MQWFLNQIRSVTIRNLAAEGKLFRDLPACKLEIFANRTLIAALCCPNNCNGTWVISGFTSDVQELLNHPDILLRFTDCNDLSQSIILERTIEIPKLIHLGSINLSKFTALPLNSIFFGSEDGFYIDEELYSVLMTSGLIPVINRSHDKIPSDGDNDSAEEDFSEGPDASHEQFIELQEKVKTSFDRITAIRAASSKEKRKKEYERILSEIAQAEADLVAEEDAELTQLSALRDISETSSEINSCDQLLTEINQMNVRISEFEEELLKKQFLLESRQIRLLSELQTIYPIEKNENGDYSIRGLELPNDLYQRDDELISSALGYTVHLLILTSKYLEIPFRYQLIFHASRSWIKDSIFNTNTLALPLFKRGNERERFERGIAWLKMDIEQLLLTRGVSYDPNREILYNINQLFLHELLPPQSI